MAKPGSTTTYRSCGSCMLCCTFLRIESKPGYSTLLDTGENIAKDAGTPCKFLTKNGCGVYEMRPIVCRVFLCDWLRGRKGFPRELPPDKLGAIGVGGKTMVTCK